MNKFDRVNLRNRAHQLKNEPLFLHESKFRDTMHLFIEIIAYKLPNAKHGFLLYIEDLIINKDIRVLVQVESVADPIEI